MSLLRRFGKDRKGVAAVEFALIAPAMILLYCGLVELCQAIIADRKTNHVASAVGDLVSQAETVSSSDLSDIFTIANTIMSPFPTSSLQIRVTSLTANASGTPVGDWSKGYGGLSALTVGQTKTLPMTLASGDSMVMSESKYTYTSVLHYVLPSALSYSEVYYLRPRRSDKVTCSDC